MTLRRHPMLDPRGRPPEMSEIVPGLFVGEYPRPEDVLLLRERHRITAVLNLQDDDDLAIKAIDVTELRKEYAQHGIELRRVPIADSDPEAVALHLDTAIHALDELLRNGATVLLHCNAGYNRAPTVAIAWLHRYRGFELAAARDHVRARRPCVPFMSILKAK